MSSKKAISQVLFKHFIKEWQVAIRRRSVNYTPRKSSVKKLTLFFMGFFMYNRFMGRLPRSSNCLIIVINIFFLRNLQEAHRQFYEKTSFTHPPSCILPSFFPYHDYFFRRDFENVRAQFLS